MSADSRSFVDGASIHSFVTVESIIHSLMRFLSILLAAGTASLALAALAREKKKRVSKLKFFSVNESGLEFGITNLPGTNGKDYVWPTLSTIDVSKHLEHSSELPH
jgi:hypothetical protein